MVSLVWDTQVSSEAETLQKDRHYGYDLQKIVWGQNECSRFEFFKKIRQKSMLAPATPFFATSCTPRPNYSLSLCVRDTRKLYESLLKVVFRKGLPSLIIFGNFKFFSQERQKCKNLIQLVWATQIRSEAETLQKDRYYGYDLQKIV